MAKSQLQINCFAMPFGLFEFHIVRFLIVPSGLPVGTILFSFRE